MLGNLNGWEFIVLALLALFIFGPERLPKVVGDAMRMLRGLRQLARNATNDLSRELGTEVRLEDLHPKTFIRKHLLSDEEEQALRRPLDELKRDLRSVESDVRRSVQEDEATDERPAPHRTVSRRSAPRKSVTPPSADPDAT